LAEAWFCRGWIKNWLGEPVQAIECFARAMRLNPFDPLMKGMRTGVAYAHSFSLCEQSRHGIGNERDQLDLELPPRMSAVGPFETCRQHRAMSAFSRNPEEICSD
jgi:hypothetical protein